MTIIIGAIDTSQRPDIRALGGSKIRILGKAWVQYMTIDISGKVTVYRHQAYIIDPKSGIKKNIISTGLLRREGGMFIDGINGQIDYRHMPSGKHYSLNGSDYKDASLICTPAGEMIQAARDPQGRSTALSLLEQIVQPEDLTPIQQYEALAHDLVALYDSWKIKGVDTTVPWIQHVHDAQKHIRDYGIDTIPEVPDSDEDIVNMAEAARLPTSNTDFLAPIKPVSRKLLDRTIAAAEACQRSLVEDYGERAVTSDLWELAESISTATVRAARRCREQEQANHIDIL